MSEVDVSLLFFVRAVYSKQRRGKKRDGICMIEQ